MVRSVCSLATRVGFLPFYLISLTMFAHPVGVCAADATSQDAYVRYDARAKTWSLGTSMVEEKLQLADGVYSVASFVSKLNQRQYASASNRPEEFRVTVERTAYTGATGGWALKGSEAKVLSTGEIQLVVSLKNDVLEVVKTYVVYPHTSIIRQWTTYRNASSRPLKVSNPYFLADRIPVEETNKLVLNYMTGGASFTGSQILKEVSFSPTYARTFDSTDKLEFAEISGVSYGGGLPWGSGAYLQWFCVRDTSSGGGLFAGFDYYGRWAAEMGNYSGGPGYLGLRVAGYNKELAPGESLETPKAFTGVFVGDLDEMGNQLKDWQYRYLWDYTSDEYFGKIRFSAEMRWQAGKGDVDWGGGTQDNWDYRMSAFLHFIGVMRYVGADILWQDAGWHDRLGDNDGPDFAQVKKYLNKSGMGLALWWPLYSVSNKSRVYRRHPEWLTNLTGWAGSHLDTSQKAVIDYLLGQLEEKITLWGDYQWRLDDTAVVPLDKDETPMLAQYHNVMGLLHDFRRRHPHSSIDICSGGGNLMGFETLRASDVSQLTDSGSLYNANYYSSYLFPPDKIDDWTRDANFTWDFARSALTMAPAWTGDRGLYGHEPGLLLNDGLENLRKTFEIYHYLFQRGVAGRWSRVYHPKVEGDEPVFYFQRLSQDGKRGVVILKHFVKGEVKVYPKGLNGQEIYDVRFAMSKSVSQRTGADLMGKGITLVDPAPGELIFLGLPNYPGSGNDHTPPSNPAEVRKKVGSNLGITGVELEWQPSTDNNWLSYYQIYRDGQMIDKVAKGTYYFDDSGGPENLAAKYEVQAVDGDANASQKVEAAQVAGGPVVYTAWGGFLAGKDYSYQGAHGWSYEAWSGPRHLPLAWNGALAQMGLYRGSTGTGSQEVLIGASWMRPSDDADAVRLFTLPYSGSITISGVVHKDIYHTYGDGVRVKVLKNDQKIWPAGDWQPIAADDITGKTIDITIPVRKSDKLYFIVNSTGDSIDDDTVWDPHITYNQIDGGLIRPERTVTNDDSTRLKYEGKGWQKLGLSPWGGDVDQGYLPGWTQGTVSASDTPGDKLIVKFRGTGVQITGQTGTDRGMASVMLDGKEVGVIDAFVPENIFHLTVPQVRAGEAAVWAPSPPVCLWGTEGLEQGEHQVVITVTGQKNPESTGAFVGIDAVVVTNGTTTGP